MGVAPPPSAAADRHDALADFLKSRRAAVQPGDVGLPADGTRRTPGLRREEVALLAGVGLSWYTWLEQGRDVRPSPQVLDAIARVLRLDAAERAHMFALARTELPLPDTAPIPDVAPPELTALVLALDPHPAYVTNALTDVLVHNAAAAVAIQGIAEQEHPNLLRWLFAAGPDYEVTARSTLARFRAAHARRIGDPAFEALIAELADAHPRFAALWPQHEVLDEQVGTKEVELGHLHHLQTIPTSHPDLRLTLYAPADAQTRAALAARVAG